MAYRLRCYYLFSDGGRLSAPQAGILLVRVELEVPGQVSDLRLRERPVVEPEFIDPTVHVLRTTPPAADNQAGIRAKQGRIGVSRPITDQRTINIGREGAVRENSNSIIPHAKLRSKVIGGIGLGPRIGGGWTFAAAEFAVHPKIEILG